MRSAPRIHWLLLLSMFVVVATSVLSMAVETDDDGEEDEVPQAVDKSTPDRAPVVTSRAALDAEAAAAAETYCPEMLEVRRRVDTLFAEFETLALTLGRREHKRAVRKLPGVGRELERKLTVLWRLYERASKPLDKERKVLEQKEGRLLDRIGRIEARNKDAARERRQADEINDKRRVLEEKMAVIEEVGNPGIRLENPEDMLLGFLIRPNEREEADLNILKEEYPALIDGRIYLAHVDAEIAALKKSQKPGETSRDAAKHLARLEQTRRGVIRKYRGVFLSIREKYVDEIKDIRKSKKKLMPRVERDRERGRSGKSERALGVLQSRMDSAERSLGVLDIFVKGTDVVTAEELKAMLAEK